MLFGTHFCGSARATAGDHSSHSSLKSRDLAIKPPNPPSCVHPKQDETYPKFEQGMTHGEALRGGHLRLCFIGDRSEFGFLLLLADCSVLVPDSNWTILLHRACQENAKAKRFKRTHHKFASIAITVARSLARTR